MQHVDSVCLGDTLYRCKQLKRAALGRFDTKLGFGSPIMRVHSIPFPQNVHALEKTECLSRLFGGGECIGYLEEVMCT